MSYQTPLPSNPSLLAIILLIKERSGPRFVCHYPPVPLHPQSRSKPRHRSSTAHSDSEPASSSASDSSFSDASDDAEDAGQGSARGSTRDGAAISRSSRDVEAGADGHGGDGIEDELESRRRAKKSSLRKLSDWDKILGHTTESLEKLLCPTSSKWHKQRFELALESLVFLSHPVFAREGSGWKRRRRRKKTKEPIVSDEEPKSESQNESDALETADHDFLEARRPSSVGEASEASASTRDADEIMTMFNVVFVMSPPQSEYHLRVKQMYDHVVKKFAKALRYQQQHSDYVWNESRAILSVKATAKEAGASLASTWPTIATKSSLAKAIATIFESISASKIATIHLDQDFDVSLQIPLAATTRLAPTPTMPQIPGLPLTTFDATDDPTTARGPFSISPYTALLLLRSHGSLLREIETDTSKELSDKLALFIRNCSPTKSLQKLTKLCQLSLQDVQFLAMHLIQWRRARAIPPIHISHTYIVSPNADFRRLPEATMAFGKRFPATPSLPVILGKLGRAPREYGHFIPSKDHKAVYKDIMAWLLRDGWVTQLRTFAWIRVSATVKAQVQDKITQEEKEAAAVESAIEEDEDEPAKDAHETGSAFSGRRLSIESRESRLTSVLSPRLRAHLYPPRPASDAGSASSGRTAVPISAVSDLASPRAKSGLAVERSPQRPVSQQSSTIVSTLDGTAEGEQTVAADPAKFKPSTILSPHKANALESRWIEHIGASFDNLEASTAWPALVKYFDGKCALEEIAAREGLKRTVVGSLLAHFVEQGVLMVVRHW